MSDHDVCGYYTEYEEFCWNDFVSWCEVNGVSLDLEEDWVVWWKCWCEGIIAYQKQSNKSSSCE